MKISVDAGHGLSAEVALGFASAYTLEGAQIDEYIDQGVLVGNRALIAKLWALNAQVEGLTVDALRCRSLRKDPLVVCPSPIQLLTEARPDTSGEGRHATTFSGIGMCHGAGLGGDHRKTQGTSIPPPLMGE